MVLSENIVFICDISKRNIIFRIIFSAELSVKEVLPLQKFNIIENKLASDFQ